MVDFTDKEIEQLKKIFQEAHPEIKEEEVENKFREYLQENREALRQKLDEQAKKEEIAVDERLPEAKEDDGWQKDVCEAVEKANTELKQKFEKYKDPDHPEHLFFKDDKNNTIAFASKEQAYVEGEQAAFDELVVSAKNLGKTKINFGKFEKHPEYKARLYLACLKHGMEMTGNIPNQEELKNSPEYAEIQAIGKPIEKKRLTAEFQRVNEDIESTRIAFFNNPKCQNLLQQHTDAKKAKNWDEVKALEEKIKATPEGEKLDKLAAEKANLFKQGIAAGIFKADLIKEIGNRKANKTNFVQKEGESDADFAARKAKADTHRPNKVQKFNSDLTKRIFKQTVGTSR